MSGDRSVWYETIIAPMVDDQQRVVGTVGIARDITRRKCAEHESLRLSGRLLQLQDEERRRIARELHDTTAQSLAALGLNLDLLQGAAPRLSTKAKGLLEDSRAVADQCAREIKTLSYLLHPPLLDELGLVGAIRDYADGFAVRSGIRIALEVPDTMGRLPKDVELALFRVLQESLANVHRHARTPAACIRLTAEAGTVRLCIQDRGCGMARSARAALAHAPSGLLGVGILGMKERLRQLGGRLEIDSNKAGTTVTATLPSNAQTTVCELDSHRG
jgi:signal transduction histidine kinase